MRAVGFDRLVNFVVDCKMPLPPLVSGVNAISGGDWHHNAFQKSRDYSDVKVVRGTIEDVSLLNRIFHDLYKNKSIPPFRSMMPSNEYDRFVEAYFDFVISQPDDYWGVNGKLSVSIFDRFSGDGSILCWVPRVRQEMFYDLRVGSRAKFRGEIARNLKSMCLDVAKLNPYLQGSPEFIKDVFLKPEGAWLFLSLMGIGVVKDAAFALNANDISEKIIISRFDKEGWIFWSAKKVVSEYIDNHALRLVDVRKFRQLFYMDSTEQAKVSSLICGEVNSKGWFVKPWWTTKEFNAKTGRRDEGLSAIDFKNRKCSQLVYDDLVKMWRNNEEIPTDTGLRRFWLSSLGDRSGLNMIKRDPLNENMLMLFDLNIGDFVHEKDIDLGRYISRFVGVWGFSD